MQYLALLDYRATILYNVKVTCWTALCKIPDYQICNKKRLAEKSVIVRGKRLGMYNQTKIWRYRNKTFPAVKKHRLLRIWQSGHWPLKATMITDEGKILQRNYKHLLKIPENLAAKRHTSKIIHRFILLLTIRLNGLLQTKICLKTLLQYSRLGRLLNTLRNWSRHINMLKQPEGLLSQFIYLL